MKKLLRKCLLAAVVVVLLAGLTVLVLSLIARQHVSRESLVAMAEAEINSRVEIGEAELSLFRLPARITLRDVALGPRDLEVGKPVSVRTPLENPPVRVKEVRLAVGLTALLKRRVRIAEFAIASPEIEVVLHEDGENSLDDLLRAPGEKKKMRRKRKKKGGEEGDEEIINAESLNVYTHGFLGYLENVRLEDAAIDLVIEKTGMVVTVRGLDAELGDLEINPAALENTPAARLSLAARIDIDSRTVPGLRYAHLVVQGTADTELFDPESGNLEPDLLADLTLADESYLNARIPVIEKAWSALQKLEQFGLKLDQLPEKATFGRSRALAVHYQRERFTLQKPISVWFKDWELALLAESWIQTEEGTHAAGGELLAEQQLSAKLKKQIGKGVDRLPNELRPALVAELESTWFREGRLVAEIASAGELGDPDVSLMNKFPDLGAIIRRAGREFLRGRLPGLADDLLPPSEKKKKEREPEH